MIYSPHLFGIIIIMIYSMFFILLFFRPVVPVVVLPGSATTPSLSVATVKLLALDCSHHLCVYLFGFTVKKYICSQSFVAPAHIYLLICLFDLFLFIFMALVYYLMNMCLYSEVLGLLGIDEHFIWICEIV